MNLKSEADIPLSKIAAALIADAGSTDVGWKAIRKRNSKKELFEYVVHAVSPSGSETT